MQIFFPRHKKFIEIKMWEWHKLTVFFSHTICKSLEY